MGVHTCGLAGLEAAADGCIAEVGSLLCNKGHK